MWQQWVNVVVGLWVLVSPFVGLSDATMTWNLVIAGAIVAALGLWGALGKKMGGGRMSGGGGGGPQM